MAPQIFHKIQLMMVVSLIIMLTHVMPGMQQSVEGESEEDSAQPLLCIIVPIRDGCGWHGYDRWSQLDFFLGYMTQWLTARGHTLFRFIISEQSQRGLFNKGVLFNIGALTAVSEGCEHLVFHDVDQLPQNPRNDYFYTGHPTHLCTWSTQFSTGMVGMRPHVGGALMMSRSDYVAVNGFSNKYWRWGLEDDDMYHRIHSIFEDFVRLPQEIGSYFAIDHDRVDNTVHKQTPEYLLSLAHLDKMRGDTVDAQDQLESDGLTQTCHNAEVIHIEHDPSKLVTFVTSDIFENSACSDAKANATKLELDEEYRRDLGMKGTCVHFLREFGLTSTITQAKRLCTGDDHFCVIAWTQLDIRNNMDRLNRVCPLHNQTESTKCDLKMNTSDTSAVFSTRKKAVVVPLLEWTQLLSTGVLSSFTSIHLTSGRWVTCMQDQTRTLGTHL